jgi:hypothetical protein
MSMKSTRRDIDSALARMIFEADYIGYDSTYQFIGNRLPLESVLIRVDGRDDRERERLMVVELRVQLREWMERMLVRIELSKPKLPATIASASWPSVSC